MNLTRREFLKALGAAGLAAALPAGAIPDPKRPLWVAFDFGDLRLRDADYTFSFFAKATGGPFPGQWARLSKTFRPYPGQRSISINLEDEKDCRWDLVGASIPQAVHARDGAILSGVQLIEEHRSSRPYIPTKGVESSRTNLMMTSHALRDRWGRLI